MTLAELRAKWESKRVEHVRLGTLVPFAAVCADVLDDLHELARASDAATLSLAEAGEETGYHPGSIARWIKSGRTKNYGTPARPRVRVGELPHKGKRDAGASSSPSVSSSSSDNMIALDALASRMDRPRSA
jgi:hypothetical protein